MEDILAHAEELGRLIKNTEVFGNYQRLTEQLRSDSNAACLLDDFFDRSREIKDRQDRGDIIEQFEIENIKSLSELVSRNETIKEYLSAQQEYLDLLLMIQKELSIGDGELE
ncbi:MAG: hypothetical protein A2176_05730 [Spirochaetes bacterium RBG_13_51_14]|nr:MAG: hypothetical protein A2176_05730 [Spirochaetes bacterium RBG_13_51_14]